MKLMTYNIWNGGGKRLPKIVSLVRKEAPDYLVLNEANAFPDNENKILKEFAKETSFPFFEIALSGEDSYHVCVLSKYPFKKVDVLHPLLRACITTLIQSDVGEVLISGFHLAPFSENHRLPEIELIINHGKGFPNRVLMGDMNSLARQDSYDPVIIDGFNQSQIKKFTTDGKLRFDVIDKLLNSGLHDTAVAQGKNAEATAPTPINKDMAHSNMRLDYFFVSEPLVNKIKNYEVIKNDLAQNSSDHYPATLTLK